MHKVLFLPHNKTIRVKDQESLIRAAIEAGVHINASCGGEGVCGKCRVIIEQGKILGGISEKLTKNDINKGYRQACLSSIMSDMIIRIPIDSNIDNGFLNFQGPPRKAALIKKINLEGLKEKGIFIPPVEKKYLKLSPPTSQNNTPDITRIIGHLKKHYNQHNMAIDLSVIRKAPDVIREDAFKITLTIVKPSWGNGLTRIINIQSGDTTNSNFALAMDIGTTTIYGQLIDLKTGSVLSSYGDFNAQISYGEDVISRIVYAEKPGGLQKLNNVIIQSINKVINRIIKQTDVDTENISTITLAGNTTMTQLMLEINPRYIRRSPYVPAASLYPPIKAADFGINLSTHLTALLYPSISSYVGGDVVAGIIGSGMYLSEKITLYMDIGTNAEIVIGNKDWLACAACSAGPAFEGGGIKFGMRAVNGAIEDFSINPFTLEPMNITIGNIRPKGICGSGLINIVAMMFEMGIIDNLGKFNRELSTNRIRKVDGVYEYVLTPAHLTQIDRDIVITEPDIDNLIRSKGAIYSGCMTLIEEVGLSINNIDSIILAGGFGSFIDLEKAMTIGLLPEINTHKITFIGNGSLLGAKISSLTNRIRKDVVEVAKKMTNFELSETASFMDNYVASLFLPYTNINLFPKLKARLEARKTAKRRTTVWE